MDSICVFVRVITFQQGAQTFSNKDSDTTFCIALLEHLTHENINVIHNRCEKPFKNGALWLRFCAKPRWHGNWYGRKFTQFTSPVVI